ncbi:sensor domain-containing diguanylate cyclase [Aestuariibacter salexigens]|uniref:GGDEF domain-containing protein n=1 Tax=Aestuariibacter salexigens TaxID=226010 RepID=UPI00042447EB|nr:sensor domain-containing diguanylate cyclase [Aestuariibacter salexigens]
MDSPTTLALGYYPSILSCHVDMDGLATFISPALAKLLVLDEEQIQKPVNLGDIFAIDEGSSFRQCISSAFLARQNTYSLQAQLINDSSRWFQFEGSFVEGESPYIAFLIHDISNEKRIQTEYSRLSKMMDSAGQFIKLGHWHIDLLNDELVWSEEIYAMHGVDRTHYKPSLQSALSFYHPDDIITIKQTIDRAIHHGEEWHFSLRIVRPSGEIRRLMSAGHVHHDEHGKPISIFGICQDITDFHSLASEKEMLTSAIQSTHLGLVVTDQKRRVTWCNKGFEEMSEYSLREVKGQNLSGFLQGEDTDLATTLQIREKLDAGQHVDTIILNYTKSGATYWNRVIITPLYEQGRISRFVGVQHDVTEEVKIKQELQRLNSSLEDIVEERTRELLEANRQLKRLAIEDPLTGAFNRRYFFEQYETEAKRALRNKQSMTLAAIDIDYFKAVNDTYGHLVGDDLLTSIVATMKSQIRNTDSIYRMGGEEFVILMSNTDKKQGSALIQRVRQAVKQTVVAHEKYQISVTISVGLLAHNGDMTSQQTLKIADELLYKAKRAGRDVLVSD